MHKLNLANRKPKSKKETHPRLTPTCKPDRTLLICII
jgi:hypothetical protein